MKDATHFLHPYYYRVRSGKVEIWSKRAWRPSAYEYASYFLMQPDLVTLGAKDDKAAQFMKKYGLRRKQVERMINDGVINID